MLAVLFKLASDNHFSLNSEIMSPIILASHLKCPNYPCAIFSHQILIMKWFRQNNKLCCWSSWIFIEKGISINGQVSYSTPHNRVEQGTELTWRGIWCLHLSTLLCLLILLSVIPSQYDFHIFNSWFPNSWKPACLVLLLKFWLILCDIHRRHRLAQPGTTTNTKKKKKERWSANCPDDFDSNLKSMCSVRNKWLG